MKQPKLRFPEFTGDWEQHKLEDVVTIGSGKDYKHLESGNVPVYGTGGYMLSVNQALSENEDAVGIGRKGTIDKPYILRAPFWTVDTLFYCVPNKGFDLTFTNCLFQNVDWKKKDESTGVPSLSKVIINNVKTYVPSLEEQQKIASLFSSLDTLIKSAEKELESYRELKQGMLQKMFPKNGEKVPEIRFPEFTGDWEQRKLGDVAKYRNGKAHESDISEQGKFVVVNSKFISTNGEVRKFSNKQIEPLLKNEIAFVLSDVPNGRAIARTFLVDKNDKYTLNQRIAGITPIEGVCPYFLHILMNRNKYFLQFDDGAKQTNLTVSDVMEFAEYYPSSEEQQQIGTLFQQLDNLIAIQQKELDGYKELKKGLLQQMFC